MKEKCQWGKEYKYNLRYIIWQKKPYNLSQFSLILLFMYFTENKTQMINLNILKRLNPFNF